MFVRVLVGYKAAPTFGLGKVVGRWAFSGLALHERVFQHPFKALPQNIAGGEGALKCVRGIAAYRGDIGGLQRLAVEEPPGHRVSVTSLDPFLAKIGLAAGKEPQIGAHS